MWTPTNSRGPDLGWLPQRRIIHRKSLLGLRKEAGGKSPLGVASRADDARARARTPRGEAPQRMTWAQAPWLFTAVGFPVHCRAHLRATAGAPTDAHTQNPTG
jgi:hypothetical protein